MPADGAPPSRARYTIVHVKQESQWRLSSVRDAPFDAAAIYQVSGGLIAAVWFFEAVP